MSVLVGKKAIDFTATAVLADGSFKDDFTLSKELEGKYGILFFYPLDFTFVCPSEIIAFHNHISEFKARNTVVIGVSVDSHFSHYAWRETPVNKGGIGRIEYPLVADLTKKIAKDYDVLVNESVALRGLFLIDKNFVVQHQLVNNLPLGRSVEEAIRMVDALQFTENHGEVCPAGWSKGKPGMKASKDGVAEYLDKNATNL